MAEQSDAEKPFEASEQKLRQAREKGDIPRAHELSAALAIAGLTAALIWTGGRGMIGFAELLTRYLAVPDRLTGTSSFAGGPIAGLAGRAVGMLLPVFILPGALVLGLLIITRAITFSPDKLAPRLSRVFSTEGLIKKFGATGLVDGLVGMTKFAIIGGAALFAVWTNLGSILAAERLPGTEAMALMGRIGIETMVHIAAAWLVLGTLDLLWQRFDFLNRQRMTRQEMLDEVKESEGDPHAKHQRRRRGQEIAMNQMIAAVAKTDVVIVNPTHYAVALKWNRGSRQAPICLAKGTDEIAARIRAAAMQAGVPIHSDPPTARALHAQIEIGQEIHPDHYKAVAAAIRFSEAMRKRARRGFR
ncbi:MAG: flagellar biosynthesis protein FlhB [Paracoccaceae bacterium]|nr:flagellar biosynthesis protein FlhB [Paracoccaceae bacterium]MDE3121424.1 flagellar biosynthesis protein FlhB [Paracoccaceae bacterium]MDE3238139.1 flagellar biosynthesis protein FlhB [Paracoccaceae bacterium]